MGAVLGSWLRADCHWAIAFLICPCSNAKMPAEMSSVVILAGAELAGSLAAMLPDLLAATLSAGEAASRARVGSEVAEAAVEF